MQRVRPARTFAARVFAYPARHQGAIDLTSSSCQLIC